MKSYNIFVCVVVGKSEQLFWKYHYCCILLSPSLELERVLCSIYTSKDRFRIILYRRRCLSTYNCFEYTYRHYVTRIIGIILTLILLRFVTFTGGTLEGLPPLQAKKYTSGARACLKNVSCFRHCT